MLGEKQEIVDSISKELNVYLKTHTIDDFVKLIVNKLPKQMTMRIRKKLANVNNSNNNLKGSD